MRALVLALLVSAGAANAAEDKPAHPLIGIAPSMSDSGFSVGGQIGFRLSSIMGRITLDAGGSGARAFVLRSVRLGWARDLAPRGPALVAGIGYGSVMYGFLFDSPTDIASVLTPEIGLLFGPRHGLGHILVSITGLLPVTRLSHERDFAGQEIKPPRVLGSVVLAF